jgi:hypothetical protein
MALSSNFLSNHDSLFLGLMRAGPYGKGYPRTPLSYTWAYHAQPFYTLQAGHPQNGLMAVSGVAHLQGGRPASSTPLDTPHRTGLDA